MNMDEFLRRLDTSGVSYELGPPLTEGDLLSWTRVHPDLRIPDALIALLRVANGIRLELRASDTGYFSLLPLHKYQPVRYALYGEQVDEEKIATCLKDEWPDHRLAISS